MSRRGSTKVAEVPRRPVDPHYSRAAGSTVHDLGEGRLEPGVPDGRSQKVLRIDVTGAPPNLLGRLLVGSYITGHDQVVVASRHGLTAGQRREIHHAVDRILGMSVVGETPTTVEVQNFIDPGKYELPRLLHRVVQMLRAELEVCRAALTEDDRPQLSVIDTIEEEVDRLYLLIVRQLLLSSESPRIARDIDVESHHYQIGDRLVAKMLELIGDLVHAIGNELDANLREIRRLPTPIVHELAGRVARLERLLNRTMDAFGHLSLVEANATLNELNEAIPKDTNAWQFLCRDQVGLKVGDATQRVLFNLDMALELLIVVNEVTINRAVEPTSEVVPAVRPVFGARKAPPVPGSSDTAIAILTPTARRTEVSHA